MTGQVAIVTGASRGYGAGIAEVLAERGARVWITGRDTAVLEAAAQRLGVSAVAADVTSSADWDRVFETVLAEAERLDILVNNAGAGIRIAPVAEQTDAELEQCVWVNMLGAMYGCRRAAPVMAKQRSGIIINISSICESEAWPGWGAYSAAKAGLKQFSHCLHTELRESGVRVTNLTPSWGATGFRAAAGIPAAAAEVERRMMQPREMGELVAQLCALPAHLVVPDLDVLPLVQEIVPY